MTPNLSRNERLLTMVAGVGAMGLAVYFLKPKKTRVALGGPRGSHLDHIVVIDASADDVYRFWRDPVQLSQALPPSVTVHARDTRLWDWALGTTGTPDLAIWTSEIIHDEPGKLLSWKTSDDSTVVSAGSVTFRELPNHRGTEVRVRMQYSPPLGKLGATVARVAGNGADRFVREYLRDIKHFIEVTHPDGAGA